MGKGSAVTIVRLGQAGTTGVVKDLSKTELPNSPMTWTDANNIRFLDGYVHQTLGYSDLYASPTIVPYHVVPVRASDGNPYLVVAGAAKIHVVNGGVYTDKTRASGGDYSGSINGWTSTLLSGVPVLNDGVNVPQTWDTNTANKFVDLTNWTSGMVASSVRAYKNFLIALGVTKSSVFKPHLVKWSSPADPGSLPGSWDHTSATVDAGEADIAPEGGIVIDGIQVRDSFLVFKQSATWRMDFVGGTYIFKFTQVSNTSGILNKNCAVELDGVAFVVTKGDIVLHDGVNPPVSILDKQARRDFFAKIDGSNIGKVFVFKNPWMREVVVAYPSLGSTYCDKALVYNYVDKTVSYRDLPNINHANVGILEASTSNLTWESDSDTWSSDISYWGQSDFTPDALRVVMASNNQKLYLLDGSAAAAGTAISAYVERVGMHFGAPESIKLVRSVRPRIVGADGETVVISVAGTNDVMTVPTYTSVSHTIGSTVSDDVLVSGRYICLKIETGTAGNWRLDSIDMDVEQAGAW